MTLEEAIAEVNTRSRNINLQWVVSKWNDGYIIHSSNFIKRHPEVEYVYSTGDMTRNWELEYNKQEKKFKHVIKER